MPGVPSGRGCDACRAQKKKCDQSKPSCSRCARLQVLCVGSGQQRFKFKQQDQFFGSSKDRRQLSLGLQISYAPSNAQTLLTDALIDKLKPSADLSYHLSWTYGGYLEDIPRRLGNSEVLDAAVDALVCAHSHFAGPQKHVAPEPLRKYSHAIATLRVSLDDPFQARTANTLCAVTLLLICQGLTGLYEGLWTSHCEGAAQILKVRGYYDKNDGFERKLLLALRGSVLFQALLSENIQLSSWEWDQIVGNELDGSSYEGRMMECLARVPDLMQRGRNALELGDSVHELQDEAKFVSQAMKLVLEDLRIRFMNQKPDKTSPLVPARLHCHYQRTYALALAISIILNCVLGALDAQDVTLEWEAARWSEEIIRLAEDAAIYRPIAASYMSICLIAAWGGSRDDETRSEAKKNLEDYLQDFSYTEVVVPMAELNVIFRRLRLIGDSASFKKDADRVFGWGSS